MIVTVSYSCLHSTFTYLLTSFCIFFFYWDYFALSAVHNDMKIMSFSFINPFVPSFGFYLYQAPFA